MNKLGLMYGILTEKRPGKGVPKHVAPRAYADIQKVIDGTLPADKSKMILTEALQAAEKCGENEDYGAVLVASLLLAIAAHTR